uniref:Uncharacterized protein n=1 Tax=Panagrolaimus sp. ES5 TaxID=591445 RepID=A0AC34F699_9BILA
MHFTFLLLCFLEIFVGGLCDTNGEGPFGGKDQSAAVMGTLKCNGVAAIGVKVKLFDNDRTDFDDEMDSGFTKNDGSFRLEGTENEVTSIDPKVYIYHDCKDNLPCQRKISITIPDEYISRGSKAETIYDIGVLNLEGEIDGESRDCIN